MYMAIDRFCNLQPFMIIAKHLLINIFCSLHRYYWCLGQKVARTHGSSPIHVQRCKSITDEWNCSGLFLASSENFKSELQLHG